MVASNRDNAGTVRQYILSHAHNRNTGLQVVKEVKNFTKASIQNVSKCDVHNKIK